MIKDLLLSLTAPLLAVPAASAVAAWGRRARVEIDAETHAAAAFALMIGWLQAGGMALGATGTLRAGPAIGWIVAGAALAFAYARRVALPAFRWAHALWLVPIAGYLLLSTVPPWQRDELVYHLALPRQFARAGGWVRPDDNIFASLPLGWESALSVLYALGRGGEPPFNPHLLTAWTAGAAALAAVGLARTLGARASWLAGAALLAVPTFVEFGSSGYVEAYLVLLTTLSLGAVARVVREPGEEAWLVPGAVLAGVGASVKYPGIAVAALLALALLAHRDVAPAGQGGWLDVPRNVRRAARFLAIAFVVGCPFYVRNAVQRHNPFFPLAFDLFGGTGWDALRAEAYWGTLRQYGEADGILDTLALPLRLFGARDLDHGFEGSIGPVAGAGAVAAVWLWRRADPARRPAVTAAALFAGLFFLFWALTVRQARFFLPAVPPLLALLAAGLSRVPGRWPAAAALAASLAWGSGTYATLWTRQRTSEWLSGRLSEKEILSQLLPESYPATQALDARSPDPGKVWLVWTRGYTYYLDRPYRLDSVFEGWRFEALLDAAEGPAALAASLRAEGFTDVLVNRRFFLQGTSADTEPGRTARLRRRFEAALAASALVPEGEWGPVVLLRVGDLQAGR